MASTRCSVNALLNPEYEYVSRNNAHPRPESAAPRQIETRKAHLHPEYTYVAPRQPSPPPYHTHLRNGRHYNAWKPGKYPFPCDEFARDDMDILNAAIFQFCYYGMGGHKDDEIPLSYVEMRPLAGRKPIEKALDLGCGSGLWVSSVAYAFPNATVVGVDLTEGQGMAVPNAIWRVPNSPQGSALDFDEDLSSLGVDTFDYVRMAHLSGAITDEAALLRKAFELAVPGSGHVEITYIDWTFRTANPLPLPASSPLSRLQEQLDLASHKRGVLLSQNPGTTGSLIASTGFADQIHRTHMLPLSSWPLDRTLNRIGEQMGAAFACYHPLEGCRCFLSGFCIELLTRWLGKTPVEVIELVIACAQFLKNDEYRVYVNFTARRPGTQWNPAGE